MRLRAWGGEERRAGAGSKEVFLRGNADTALIARGTAFWCGGREHQGCKSRKPKATALRSRLSTNQPQRGGPRCEGSGLSNHVPRAGDFRTFDARGVHRRWSPPLVPLSITRRGHSCLQNSLGIFVRDFRWTTGAIRSAISTYTHETNRPHIHPRPGLRSAEIRRAHV